MYSVYSYVCMFQPVLLLRLQTNCAACTSSLSVQPGLSFLSTMGSSICNYAATSATCFNLSQNDLPQFQLNLNELLRH